MGEGKSTRGWEKRTQEVGYRRRHEPGELRKKLQPCTIFYNRKSTQRWVQLMEGEQGVEGMGSGKFRSPYSPLPHPTPYLIEGRLSE